MCATTFDTGADGIGLLTQPVDPVTWLARVRSRYAFVISLDEVEKRVARVAAGDRYEVSQLVAACVTMR